MSIEVLKNTQIETALDESGRQYLAGDLKRMQKITAIFDSAVEAGISKYAHDKADAAHYHAVCTEYQYVLEGRSKYLDVDTNEVVEVEAGDFFVIHSKTKYYQKSAAGTKILFIKVPGGNDKCLVPLSEEQERWGRSYECDV